MDIVPCRIDLFPRRNLTSWHFMGSADPLYVAFHDEEWGVPVHDDK